MERLGAWQNLAPDAIGTVKSVVIGGLRASLAHVSEGHEPAGYSVLRSDLDLALMQAAEASGATSLQGWRLLSLSIPACDRETELTLQGPHGEQETLRAKLVIGADGAHSRIARRSTRVQVIPRLQRVAVITHWRNASGPRDSIEMRVRGGVVCGMGFPGGEDRANVTFVAPLDRSSEIAGRPGAWAEQMLAEHFPEAADRLSGAGAPESVQTAGCFAHYCRPPAADGVLLAGDAATFVDPFTGEGVYFALRGAEMAAEAASAALHAGDTSMRMLGAYVTARKELTRRYLLCGAVQAVVRQPYLLASALSRLASCPAAAARLLRVLGDMRPPEDLLSPSFLWTLVTPVP